MDRYSRGYDERYRGYYDRPRSDTYRPSENYRSDRDYNRDDRSSRMYPSNRYSSRSPSRTTVGGNKNNSTGGNMNNTGGEGRYGYSDSGRGYYSRGGSPPMSRSRSPPRRFSYNNYYGPPSSRNSYSSYSSRRSPSPGDYRRDSYDQRSPYTGSGGPYPPYSSYYHSHHHHNHRGGSYSHHSPYRRSYGSGGSSYVPSGPPPSSSSQPPSTSSSSSSPTSSGPGQHPAADRGVRPSLDNDAPLSTTNRPSLPASTAPPTAPSSKLEHAPASSLPSSPTLPPVQHVTPLGRPSLPSTSLQHRPSSTTSSASTSSAVAPTRSSSPAPLAYRTPSISSSLPPTGPMASSPALVMPSPSSQAYFSSSYIPQGPSRYMHPSRPTTPSTHPHFTSPSHSYHYQSPHHPSSTAPPLRERPTWAADQEKEMERYQAEDRKLMEDEIKCLAAVRKGRFDLELGNWETSKLEHQLDLVQKQWKETGMEEIVQAELGARLPGAIALGHQKVVHI